MHKVNNTERLSISLMSEKDEALLWELDQDPLVMKYINGGVPSTKADISEVFIPRVKSYTDPKKGWGLWKVLTLSEQTFIGWVLVRPMCFFSEQPQVDNLEIGWRFKQLAWGKGYATEAASAVKGSFSNTGDRYGVSRFSAIALPENTASINIMQKLGMHFEKTALHQDPLGDLVLDYYSVEV